MNVADYVQAGVLLTSAISFGAMMLNRYAVANHNDRLARLTGACGNAAGTIRDKLNDLPAGADLPTARAALIAAAVPALMSNFSQTVAKLDATPDHVAGIVAGQLGQIPAAPAVAVASALEPMAMQALETHLSAASIAGIGAAVAALLPVQAAA